MHYTKHKAFTLVELIVVVTILAILATIGFVSYSSYLTGVRDTNRLAQLVSISDGLELYRTKNDLPLPDDNIEVQTNGETIAYQGYAGSNTLETIDFTKGGKDPKDDAYFTYYLTKDRKYYQLMGFLEESENLSTSTNVFPQTHANYEDRIPTVYGKKLGVLTDLENTPIQDLGEDVNITPSNTVEYIAHIDSNNSIESTGLELVQGVFSISVGRGHTSCKSILNSNSDILGVDGEYWITTGGESLKVYCDMTNEEGGWTLVWHGYPTQAETMLTEYEKVNIAPGIEFDNIMVKGTNLDYYVTDTTSKTAKLIETIPYYFNYVGGLPDTPNPSVLLHSSSGIQDVSLVGNNFFYGYGNTWRVFYGCVYVAGPLYSYIGGSCPPESNFISAEVGCTGGGDAYCNGNVLDDNLKDSGLGLSMKEYHETQVFIK